MAKATEKATAMHTPGIKLTEQIIKKGDLRRRSPFLFAPDWFTG
jgi:hypothetical protein